VNTRERLELIREDCKADAARPVIDHFHEPTPAELRAALSVRLGEVYAMIDALAASMLEQEDRIDRAVLA
jgi:hypothetical protein